jgi:hypothetical protein
MNMKKENIEVKLTPNDIDNIIEQWNQTKQEIKRLHDNEEKYKLVINRIMDIYGADSINGKNLKISRYNISRKFLSKNNVPPEIYEKYAIQRDIICFRINKKKF